MIGHPSAKDCKAAVQLDLIKNCPISLDDAKRAEKIHGPSITALKGKTTCVTPLQVHTDLTLVPEK